MDFLKTVTGKVVGGLVGLAVIAAGISWWRMDAATRYLLLTGTGRIVSWAGIVLIVPWATFFLIGWVARFERNSAGAALVVTYTAAEALLLAWLFHWSVPSPTAWTFFAVGTLFAGVDTLFTCDWIAERAE
jgi:FtsH-binding integral membrane protein